MDNLFKSTVSNTIIVGANSQHAPGVPKVLVGNRLHLAFKRQVAAKQAELYAQRNKMSSFEISPLCDFNIRESFCELARMALHRNGMERIWRSNKVLSLQELCCRTIVRRTSVYAIDTLPLPPSVKSNLKSYALTSSQCFNTLGHHQHHLHGSSVGCSKKGGRCKTPTQNVGVASGGSGSSLSIGCSGSSSSGSGGTRNSCSIS